MIRIASQQNSVVPAWHEVFSKMERAIETHARIAFRHLRPEERAEAVQDVLCNVCSALARLDELDKLDLAYPSVLARFGVAQVKDGRKVGCHRNIRDVSSPYCQRRKKIAIERLDKFDAGEECWQEILIPDQTCTPADLAASRIDFPAWLDTLKPRDRRIAVKLAAGETTSRVSRLHRLSPGRISQLRRALKAAWEKFTSEAEPPQAAGLPA